MSWLGDFLKKKNSIPVISKKPDNNRPYAHGIDVSHHNTVNLAIASKEQSFIFLKASEGENYTDEKFTPRWRDLELLGTKRGAYHFYRADKDALKQARHFCDTVGKLKPTDDVVLDMETLDGKTIVELKISCQIFLNEVERITGKIPIIYSGYSFLVDMNLDNSFAKYPLWLARYTSIDPLAPSPWAQWDYWQYSETMTVNGVGICDTNWKRI
jgi:lysozyme